MPTTSSLLEYQPNVAVLQWGASLLSHGSLVYSLAISPDRSRLAFACHDNTIRLWDVATREEVTALHGHQGYVHAVEFSPDGTQLASGSGDHTVRTWDSVASNVRARSNGLHITPRNPPGKRFPGPIRSWIEKETGNHDPNICRMAR